MTSFSTQPQSFFLDSIQALQAWTPATQPYDAFNIGQVPLQPRPAASRPLVMDGNDFKGGYVNPGDLYPQGVANLDTYNFTYWQYLDSFYYFAHRRVAIPTAWWINAGHLNGVPVMGTVDFEGSSQDELGTMLGAGSSQYIAQLASLARHYNFDGWFFNVETSLPAGTTAAMLASFLTALDTTLKANNPNALVIWYDAVDCNGNVNYQNCLNQKNNIYFEACDGIFPNYWWFPDGTGLLQTSISTAQGDGRSPLAVYSGVYVWAAQTQYQPGNTDPGNDAVAAVGACVDAGTSVGLFAPGWTFETATGTWPSAAHHQAYETKDTSLWTANTAGYNSGAAAGQDCIAEYIPERIIPGGLPFATNFDRGCGTNFIVRGTQAGTTAWSNLSLQGLQPTYRFWSLAGSASSLSMTYAYGNGYDGGASLVVQGADAAASDTANFRLFDLQAPVTGSTIIQVIFKPQGTPFPGIQVTLVFSDTSSYTTTSAASPLGQSGWLAMTETTTGITGKTVTQIVLAVGPSSNGNPPGTSYGAVIGQVSLVPADAAPPAAVQDLAVQPIYADAATQGALLSWSYPTGAARFFDIWRTDGATPAWLMRVCANAVWIGNLGPVGGPLSASFAVQPVDYSLTPQALAGAATVSLSVSPTSFNDGPTIALVGMPPITALTIMSGDILNAIQATNGTYALPQHGDTSGGSNSITLQAGETVTGATITTGMWFGRSCVAQLSLTTSQGRSLGPYGTMANVTAAQSTSYTAPAGQGIVAFSGTLVNVPLASGPAVNIVQTLMPAFG
ncbi:MAG: endo-beta-N-acetylglucosaminidase [Ferrovibrionaceae bacterium]